MEKAILIIDDCELTREILWEILKTHYRVFLASTAWEGIKMLSKEICLVLLDLCLPDLDGLDVLKEIKRDYPSIPVVIITGYGTEERCLNAFRLGARDYIKKPFENEEIPQKVELLLNTVSTERRRPVIMSSEKTNNYMDRKDIPDQILKGIFRVRDYIEKNPRRILCLSDACKLAGLNRAYFCHFFKYITGHSYKSYLHHIKLKAAKELLRNKGLRISDVAEHIGYSTEHFSRAFRKIYGNYPKKSSK